MSRPSMSGRAASGRPPRCRGDRGAGMALALVLMFTLTAGGVIWLARDVDRAASNRATAQSIAFQAARAGAQRIDVVHLRAHDVVAVDDTAARRASAEVVSRLLAAHGLAGEVTRIEVAGDLVTVVITVVDGGRSVTGVGAARATDGRNLP